MIAGGGKPNLSRCLLRSRRHVPRHTPDKGHPVIHRSWKQRCRLRTLVVGAGIAGLGAARALRQRGLAADVVEREPAWTHTGSGHLPARQRDAGAAALGLESAVAERGSRDHRTKLLRPPGPPAGRHRRRRPVGQRRPLPRAAPRGPARDPGIPRRPRAGPDGPIGAAPQPARRHRDRRVRRRHRRPATTWSSAPTASTPRSASSPSAPVRSDRSGSSPGASSPNARRRSPRGRCCWGERHLPGRADRSGPGLLLLRHTHRAHPWAAGRRRERAARRAADRIRRPGAGHPRHARPRRRRACRPDRRGDARRVVTADRCCSSGTRRTRRHPTWPKARRWPSKTAWYSPNASPTGRHRAGNGDIPGSAPPTHAMGPRPDAPPGSHPQPTTRTSATWCCADGDGTSSTPTTARFSMSPDGASVRRKMMGP